MNLNKFIFTAPKSSYTEKNKYLRWIPSKQNPIPIFWIENLHYNKRLVIYFHANATDINTSLRLVTLISNNLKVNL